MRYLREILNEDCDDGFQSRNDICVNGCLLKCSTNLLAGKNLLFIRSSFLFALIKSEVLGRDRSLRGMCSSSLTRSRLDRLWIAVGGGRPSLAVLALAILLLGTTYENVDVRLELFPHLGGKRHP